MVLGKTKENDVNQIIEALKEIQNSEFISKSEIFYDSFESLIQRLSDQSFRIAVVGEFSSGKSTFLNALIGEDLLKHGAQETTATVTEIYNDPNCGNQPLMDVYYTDGSSRKGVSAEEITEVTATNSLKHSVAEEIDKVIIRSKILDTDARICFIDTPGLNGIADNHREKTIAQIKNAHACIYLIQVRGLGQSDIEFLRYICKYQKNIIFVQNFIDELKELEGETPEEKIIAQRRIIDEKIIENDVQLNYRLVAISARKALIAQAKEFSQYNGELLSDELRMRLWKESKFDCVIDEVNCLIEENEKNRLQQHDTVEIALDLLKQLRSIMTLAEESERKEWEGSAEGIAVNNYKELINYLKENRLLYVERLDNFVESEVVEIRRESEKEVTQEIERIEEKAVADFSQIDEIDALEQYIMNSLPMCLYSEISKVEENTNRQIQVRFENLICNAILRIQQYTGENIVQVNAPKFDANKIMIDLKMKDFSQEENQIENDMRRLSSKKGEEKIIRKKIEETSKKIEEIDSDFKKTEAKLKRIKTVKTREINELGEMPKEKKVIRKEKYQESRHGIGKILDFLIGKKEKIREVPYYDNTEQNEWLKEKEKIEKKYTDSKWRIEKEKRTLEQKRKMYENDLVHQRKLQESNQKYIENQGKVLEAKTRYLEVQKEKAKNEYLSEMKRSVSGSVKKYLYDTIETRMIDDVRRVISGNKEDTSRIIKNVFEVSYNQRIRSLEKLIGTSEWKNDDGALTKLDEAIKKLEEFVCL